MADRKPTGRPTAAAAGSGRPLTIKDVAAAAGVGLGTVSRALSGNGQVSEATRQRVLLAAEQLGYRPSALGRGLKRQRTDNLGLIVADIGNPFYGQLADGVLSAAKALSRHVIVCATSEDPATEAEYVDLLIQQRVDGIIAVPTGTATDCWADAQRLGINLVFLDRTVDGLDVPCVLVDNAGGAKVATEYLLALGHRRIAYLGGPLATTTGRQREAGFRAAHETAGIEVDEEMVVRSRYTWDTAHASALALLEAAPDATALFVANNVLGEAALAALRTRGLRAPDDLSVIMFDDVPWAELTTPAITVVSQPTRQMGQQAARMAVLPPPEEGRVVVMDASLVVRASCKPQRIPRRGIDNPVPQKGTRNSNKER